MSDLSANEKSFVQFMLLSDEHARHGFKELASNGQPERFFRELLKEGLFDPRKNPGPIPTDQQGAVHIPYWSALDYLLALAHRATQLGDQGLDRDILSIVETVSAYRDSNGAIRDNFHTYWKFAEILGVVSLEAIKLSHLELIPTWLRSKYDNGGVAHELDRGLLQRLLGSKSRENSDRALLVLSYCTAMREAAGTSDEVVTVVDDYWLKELIGHHAEAFGQLIGQKATNHFAERVRVLFKAKPSWLARPAIEEHAQNHDWEGPANRFIEGTRDVLRSWIKVDPSCAGDHIISLVGDQSEAVRRIAIRLANENWALLSAKFQPLITASLFTTDHWHELYGLLSANFREFSDDGKRRVCEAIAGVSISGDVEDRERKLDHLRRDWLSAIVGKGSADADAWFSKLISDKKMGAPSDHPDFLVYMESSWGPGPSPLSAEELVGYARDGTLVTRVNEFVQRESWRGASTRALADTIEIAVGLDIQAFADILDEFHQAKRPYQYGVLSGFKRAWDALPVDQTKIQSWNGIWAQILEFARRLVDDRTFWTETVVEDPDMAPTRNWIPPLLADMTRAGTTNDAKSAPPELLPMIEHLIKVLLENCPSEGASLSDPMSLAINSPRGKAIEALFSYTLRGCRLADRTNNEHGSFWTTIKPVFEAEVGKCKGSNHEFSTLAAASLSQLQYIDPSWLEANILRIFPAEHETNFISALGGLAYSRPLQPTYKLLVTKGVIDNALASKIPREQTRERLVEQIALGYLWGIESIDSARFERLFASNEVDDLTTAIDFFWAVRDQKLTEEQRSLILRFWKKVAGVVSSTRTGAGAVLSALSKLSVYLTTVSDDDLTLLVGVAPFVQTNRNAFYFVEQLDRLATASPANVAVVFHKMLDATKPSMDFKNHLKSVILKLAAGGQRASALSAAEKLYYLDGMRDVYGSLTEAG